ncbi:Uncharacterized protein APZ42_011217 [Daphnia magna]|uniref:Uncharacterized protein n=1 Tax=Daphnia magna TaxID=35525 RepID=A0A162SHI8_9CRUS|nr:Uncharacterized protein APZ42_011217 [Daphnia magna]
MMDGVSLLFTCKDTIKFLRHLSGEYQLLLYFLSLDISACHNTEEPAQQCQLVVVPRSPSAIPLRQLSNCTQQKKWKKGGRILQLQLRAT